VNEVELGEIVGRVTQWMQMEQEVVEAERSRNGTSGFNTFGKTVLPVKYTYSAVYLQVLLLAVNFYDKLAGSLFNTGLIVERVIQLSDNFRCDYEITRVIVGFSHILENKMVGEEGVVRAMVNALPELVRRLCKLWMDGDTPDNDLEMDDEAEEERLFGED
jgi:hypothetical protein